MIYPNAQRIYIHRIGRTARAGAQGQALNFVAPSDRSKWAAIERLLDPEKAKESAKPRNNNRKGRSHKSKSHRGKGNRDNSSRDRGHKSAGKPKPNANFSRKRSAAKRKKSS